MGIPEAKLAVVAVAAVVLAGCVGGGGDVAEMGSAAQPVELAAPVVEADRDVHGGPDGPVAATLLPAADDGHIGYDRGRSVRLAWDNVAGRWRLASFELGDGRRLWDLALPEWHEQRPEVLVANELVVVYGDRPNPELGATRGQFNADEVPSRVQLLDAYRVGTGERVWATGPLSGAANPEDVPARMRTVGQVVVAGQWAVGMDGQVLWSDPQLADWVFDRDVVVDGQVATVAASPAVQVDVAAGTVREIGLPSRPVAVTARHAVTDSGGQLTVHPLDGGGPVQVEDGTVLGQLGRRAGQVSAVSDGAAVHVAAAGEHGLVLFTVDGGGAVEVVHAGQPGQVKATGGWLAVLTEMSQSETRLDAVGPDGRQVSFQVTYRYGQAGQPDVYAAVDGLLYLTAGDRLFTIDPDGPELVWDTETRAAAGPIVAVDAALVVAEDPDGRTVVVHQAGN